MTKATIFLLLVCVLTSSAHAQPPTYCIRDVTVINPQNVTPAEPHKDVYLRGDEIIRIENTTKESAKLTRNVIDGHGKFLMAGLSDMHVHLPKDHLDQFFYLNLAAGVTTVRSMRGKPGHLDLRRKIVRGEMTGPDLILATPYFPNKNIKITDLKDSIKAYAKAGYDCIKVLAVPDSAYFEALMDAAQDAGLPVVGHWPRNVSIDRVIEDDYSCIEHLDGIYDAFIKDSNCIKKIAADLNQHHTWNCPTLDYYNVQWLQVPLDELHKRDGLDLLDHSVTERWDSTMKARFAALNAGSGDSVERKREKYRIYIQQKFRLLQMLDTLGPQFILSPAEANDEYGVPGFCVWEEMKLLAKCGISSQKILTMATYNAAMYMDQEDKWGSVAPLRRANLVLLDKNPLESIENIRSVEAVFLRGEYHTVNELRQLALLAR
ncbi:MAG TPA: amidohydrolase family protein [Candidatus Kapabacteria bacterium]|nr:amidohydrolase family protein [Candidatus Kapabacteria bacterium]